MKELKRRLGAKEIKNLNFIKGGDDDGTIKKGRVKIPGRKKK